MIECEELFNGKYRIQSARLAWWDYSRNAAYFITICTRDRKEHFGEIHDGIMALNALGCVAARYWQEIPNHFEHVILDEWVVMPNHVHGILILDDRKRADRKNGAKKIIHATRRDVALQRLYGDGRKSKHPFFSGISPKPKSVSTIIRSFKSAVTKHIRQKCPNTNFNWQPRFHDRIIRDERELNAKRGYIRNNPQKWETDRNHPDNLLKHDKFG